MLCSPAQSAPLCPETSAPGDVVFWEHEGEPIWKVAGLGPAPKPHCQTPHPDTHTCSQQSWGELGYPTPGCFPVVSHPQHSPMVSAEQGKSGEDS